MRVSWIDDPSVSDTGFTILDRINVIAPNGGEAWRIGQTHTIRFGHKPGASEWVLVEAGHLAGRPSARP